MSLKSKIMVVLDWSQLFHRLQDGQADVNQSQVGTFAQTSVTPVQPTLSEVEYLTQLERKVIAAMENGMISRRDRLEKANPRPKQIKVLKTVFDVNPDVIAEVMLRANGFCRMRYMALLSKKGSTTLPKIHYKTPLEQGGLDIVDNATVCPNCYEKLNDR